MNRDNIHVTAITPYPGNFAQPRQHRFSHKALGGAVSLLLTLCAALLGLAAPSQAQNQTLPNPQPATITSVQYTATGATLTWAAQSMNYGISIPFGNYRPYGPAPSNGKASFTYYASYPVATYSPYTNLWTETGTFTISSLHPVSVNLFL